MSVTIIPPKYAYVLEIPRTYFSSIKIFKITLSHYLDITSNHLYL